MEDVLLFLRSPNGTMAALGALLAGISAVVKAIVDVRLKLPSSGRKSFETSLIVSALKKPIFYAGAVLILMSATVFAARAYLSSLPLNAKLTSEAWVALDRMDYSMALAKAQECVDAFEQEAVREQEALVAKRIPPPPTGSVSGDETREILSHSLLNDVATCLYIKGISLEKLNRLAEAREAYRKAQRFPYGRTFDPRGWFWSPAGAASARLAGLP